MNHKEFLSEVQKTCQAEYPQCTSMLSALLKLMVKAAVEQIPVTIHGLGTFTSHKHPEYIQENQQTGEQMLYPPRISYRMHSKQPDAPSIAPELSETSHQSIELCETFLHAMAQVIVKQLENRDEVKIHGLGNFYNIEAHQTELHRVAFTPDETMREQVNAPFNCFEPVVITKGVEVVAEPVDTVEETPVENAPIENATEEDLPEATDETEEDQTVEVEQQPILEEEEAADPIIEDQVVGEVQPALESVELESPAKSTVEQTQTDTPVEQHPEAPVTIKQGYEEDEEEEEEQHSSNRLLVISLSLIVISCVTLLVGLFMLDRDDYEEAELASVNHATVTRPLPQDSLMAEVIDSTKVIEADTSLVAAVVESTPVAEPEKSASVVEPANPVPASEPVKPAPATEPLKPVVETASKPEPVAPEPKTFHRLMGPDGNPVTVTLNPGERLTIVSLNQYGDKAFWPYVFDVNSDRIKAPNLVQAGMRLYLPDPAYYDIDPQSEESLRKAKNRAAQLLK